MDRVPLCPVLICVKQAEHDILATWRYHRSVSDAPDRRTS
jgi:hypothetical protein